MFLNKINGLPAHVLLVHVVVIGVPLAALLTVLSAVWPAAQRRLGAITPLVAAGALITVPITMRAGEWLRDRVTPSPLIARHAKLGDELLPWAIGVFLAATAQWWWCRRTSRSSSVGSSSVGSTSVGSTSSSSASVGSTSFSSASSSSARPHRVGIRHRLGVDTAIAALSIVLAVGAVVQVYRIGDSGAKAVWTGSFSSTARSPAG